MHNPKYIFHIGTHKTATSTLQAWLSLNRDLLRDRDILYPHAGCPPAIPTGQHQLAWNLRGKHREASADAWTDLLKEVAQVSPKLVLISAEDFERCSEHQIESLSRMINYSNVRVILYLRNPLKFMQSAFKQQVKASNWSGTSSQFLANNMNRCNYKELISRWQHWVGKKHMIVRLFDKVIETSDIITDFAASISIDANEFRAATAVNESLSHSVIESLLVLNQMKQRFRRTKYRDRIFSVLQKSVRRKNIIGKLIRTIPGQRINDSIFSPEDIAVLRDKSIQWNEELFGTVFDEEDRKYFEIATSN